MSLEDIRNKNKNVVEDKISYEGFEFQEDDLKFLKLIKQKGGINHEKNC